jgi:hypothetical protein
MQFDLPIRSKDGKSQIETWKFIVECDTKELSRGKGSLIAVKDGAMVERRVRLEADILPEMPGHYATAISIGPWRGTIEIFKLAL